MPKLANLTIRMETTLKRQAEEAAKMFDVSISQVIRHALRALVNDAASQKARYQKLPEHMDPYRFNYREEVKHTPLQQPNGTGGKVADAMFDLADPAKRLQELLAKEKRGHLTRLERDQKKALQRANVGVFKD